MTTQATWHRHSGIVSMPRALIADDQRAVAEVVARACADLAVFDLVPSGRDAIARLKSSDDYRAILCDVRMPCGGGREVVEFLKDHAPHLLKRVVLMSGAPLREPWAQGVARVQKPFDFDALRAIIDPLLQTSIEQSGTFRAG